MTDSDYKKLFWQRDLPIDFELWQGIAKGLVDALKNKNVDMYYVNQAEHFKATLELVGANLSAYAEVVLKEIAQVDGWSKAAATPEDVRGLCKLFASTVDAYSPSRRINDLRDKIESLRDDVRSAQSEIDSLEDELDGIRDDLNDAEEELKDWLKAREESK